MSWFMTSLTTINAINWVAVYTFIFYIQCEYKTQHLLNFINNLWTFSEGVWAFTFFPVQIGFPTYFTLCNYSRNPVHTEIPWYNFLNFSLNTVNLDIHRNYKIDESMIFNCKERSQQIGLGSHYCEKKHSRSYWMLNSAY